MAKSKASDANQKGLDYESDMEIISSFIVKKNKNSYVIWVDEYEIKIEKQPEGSPFKLLQVAYEYIANDVEIMGGSEEFMESLLAQSKELVDIYKKYNKDSKVMTEWIKELEANASASVENYDEEIYGSEEDEEDEDLWVADMNFYHKYVNDDYQNIKARKGTDEPKPTIPCKFEVEENKLILTFRKSSKELATEWINKRIKENSIQPVTVLDIQFKKVDKIHFMAIATLDAEYE